MNEPTEMSLRLAEFRIYGLFGLFEHKVPFNLTERITIIHAPNGYGKTVILKLIRAMFGGSLAIFREFNFKKIEYIFNNGTLITVEQNNKQEELFQENLPRQIRTYEIHYYNGKEVMTWSPDDVKPYRDKPGAIPTGAWERYIPFITRIGPRNWKDDAQGDVIGISELIERYIDHLPRKMRDRTPTPDWLENVRSSINCRLIETQRLVSFERSTGPYGQDEPSMTLAVQKYSEELRSSIERTLAESATLSQSLDQTFPNRLLERMSDKNHIVNEKEIRKRLSELEKQRNRLSHAGLLNTAEDSTIISRSKFDTSTLKILSTYTEDTKKKLSIYDSLLEKIELLLDVINSRFQFKSISIERNSGFHFKSMNNTKLKAENLSSGEQHELVMIYELLFKSKKNSLVLIDEPEISLHIAWQKRFLSDLRRIIELTGIDTIVSTHSPQLIGPDLELAVQLQPPNEEIHN